MKISIGSDHSGFELKNLIIKHLQQSGYDINDVGCYSLEVCDYPDFAKLVCEDIVLSKACKGILICGTGIGMSIYANRIPGVRAALCVNEFMAKKSREHNNANILVLGAKITNFYDATKIVEIFMKEVFDGGRHLRRLNKII